jgi:hypothetical protein
MVGSPRGWWWAVLRFAGALARPWGWRDMRDIEAGEGSGSCVVTPHPMGGNYTRKQIRGFRWCWGDGRDWTGGTEGESLCRWRRGGGAAGREGASLLTAGRSRATALMAGRRAGRIVARSGPAPAGSCGSRSLVL